MEATDERYQLSNLAVFEDRHRDWAAELDAWCIDNLSQHGNETDTDADCINLVRALGKAGFLQPTAGDAIDVRTLCLARETLARHHGLADFAFAMQGLGTGAISLFGTDEQKNGSIKPALAKPFPPSH